MTTKEYAVLMVDGHAVVNTGADDDNVKVTVDPDTDGNDRIQVSKGTNLV